MVSSTIGFQDLMRLAFPDPLIVWLQPAGVGQGQAVHWVALALEDLHQGDVWLARAEEVDPQALRQAKAAGAAGIVLVGAASMPDELPGGIPIVTLNGIADTHSTQRLLLTLLLNQRAGLIERGYRIHLQFAQLSAEGAGLEGLVQAMADISGRGVLVQDKRGSILAEQASPVLKGIWNDVLAQLSPLDSLPESLKDRKMAGRQSAPVLQEIPGGLVRLVSPVTVGGIARGYLSLVGLPEEMDGLDELVAEQGRVICAIEMHRSKAVREAEKRLQGDLLTALLQGGLSARDSRLWAQSMGLDLGQAHLAMRFAWGHQDSPSRRRLETLVHGEVARLGLHIIVTSMGAEVICFCEAGLKAGRPETALQFGQGVLEKGKGEHPDSPVLCGMGAPVENIEDWHVSFRQAGQALEMGRRLETARLLYFPDLSIYRLLFQIEHNPELIAFQEEMLGPLLAQENSQELIHTLETYFRHNSNVSQSAEALFIHRNTLNYRLERIAEILNQDLEKPETRLALQLALYIHTMSGPQRTP